MYAGAYTAIVTPFTAQGEIDFSKLRELIELQVAAGIDGIIPVGTTGESPTLNYAEHKKVVEVCVEACRKRIKVIAGTGANSTAEAIDLTEFARQVGADATLQVTPYYNKPNQEGLIRHFSTVADIGLPVVLYNVPSRCGTEIAVETVVKLAAHPNIKVLKEAGGSVQRVSQVLAQCDICVLSGDDPLTLPMMAVGARGVISVASNLVPEIVATMVHSAMAGRWEEARRLHRAWFPLFQSIFLDSNPIPIKAAMAMKGMIAEVYRPPLGSMSPALKNKLAECLRSLKVL